VPPATAAKLDAQTLRLDPIAGPPLAPIALKPGDAPVCIGRASTCHAVLSDPDGIVSRLHAELDFVGRPGVPAADGVLWRLTDKSSRHGTWVNGNRLTPETPVPLRDGDRVRVGPWTLRVGVGPTTSTGAARLMLTSDDRASTMTMIKRVQPDPLAGAASRRLELLMRYATAVGGALTEADIAAAAIEALSAGTGFPRLAVLRRVGDDQVEVLSSKGPADAGFSRTLLQGAAEGQTVVLTASDTPNYGQSVLSLGITAALCAPVLIDGQPDAFLYLDARGGEAPASSGAHGETAAFTQAIAKLCGLGFADLLRKRIKKDEEQRRIDLDAARKVQQIIMPPSSGTAGRLSYHMHSVPGRDVAGDLFDFFAIDGRRAGVLLGDVVGKGVAAGMIMANVQAHLSRLLRHTGDPAATLNEINDMVNGYSHRSDAEGGGPTLFLSLWAGVVDLEAGLVRFVDAGHGYALMRTPGERPVQIPTTGGPPLGIALGFNYEADVQTLPPGSRLILFSDGVAEQQSPTGAEFGIPGAIESLATARTPVEEVRGLIAAVRRHAGGQHAGTESPFADDVTVASIAVE